MNSFLPVCQDDVSALGWDSLDFIVITGDAYVDHPSFGAAIISRLLTEEGYRVGIISQPDWRSIDDFRKLGRPNLAFLITAGNLDSMVNHYTASKKRRREDEYAPGGVMGKRPDRATIAYSSRAKEAYKGVQVIIGGIEASMRRLAHYDYWDDKVRRSILIDAKADYLIYGMAETQMIHLARLLRDNESEETIRKLPGICYKAKQLDHLVDYFIIPGFEEVSQDKKKYANAFRRQTEENDPFLGKAIAQYHDNAFVIQNPPAKPLTTAELDRVYALPYVREWHPQYDAQGGVPALQEVKFSITTHRGCFGGCAFCAIHFHQGAIIQSRSEDSILKEIYTLTKFNDFKGVIHDVGGPTANMYQLGCSVSPPGQRACSRSSCLYPNICPQLDTDHGPSISLLEKARAIPGVKKVFIRSGIRYDLLMADSKSRYIDNLCSYHISGQLKVAPEHAVDAVTHQMNKPGIQKFDEFVKLYRHVNENLGKPQYLVPYFIASHPGCTLDDAIALAQYIKKLGHYPEQVQDFTPTPGTLSTAIYYTGINPMTGETVYVPRTETERKYQRALMQFFIPTHQDTVREALTVAGRTDLIGKGADSLVPNKHEKKHTNTRRNTPISKDQSTKKRRS